MKIHVIVKTRSKKTKVEKTDEQTYTVGVREPPVDGKANEAVIRALSDELHIPKSKIHLMAGERSKHKYFLIS